jgi:hypothetical protein
LKSTLTLPQLALNRQSQSCTSLLNPPIGKYYAPKRSWESSHEKL